MEKGTAKIVKNLFIAISLLWMAGMGWLQFGTLTAEDVLTPHSAAVRDRMDNECSGTFERRYDCKETIAINTVRNSLANMVMRIGIVVSIPALLALGFQSLTRPARAKLVIGQGPLPPSRRTASHRPTPTVRAPDPETEVEEEPVEDDMSWKKTAQRHVTQGRPPDQS